MEDEAIYRDIFQFEEAARLAKAEQQNQPWVGYHSSEFISLLSPSNVLRLLAVLRADMQDAERYREMVKRAQELSRSV